MVKSSNYIQVRAFDGFPKASDLQLVEEELPPLKNGEFLCEAEWLSIDPFIRIFMAFYPLGSVMTTSQVARVTESKNPEFPVGCHVCGHFGWRTHTISNGTVGAPDAWMKAVYKIPYTGLPLSLALGVLGMPGVTAYEGFLGVCEPKEGDVVVVSAAAGAVGSVVGQLAKLKGCTTIGYAGSDLKVNYLKKIGFDHAYNYKKVNLDTSLKEAAPNGVNCYFDTIGGEFLETVASNMAVFGRIVICGNIAEYNSAKGEKPKGNIVTNLILQKQLRVEGFHVHRSEGIFIETVEKLTKLVSEKKILYDETVHEGFKNAPNAFFECLDGQNLGKMVLKL